MSTTHNAGRSSLYYDAVDRGEAGAQLESRPLAEWTNDDVGSWIQGLEFDDGAVTRAEMAAAFTEHNITGSVLQDLTSELLREMGFADLRARLVVRQKIDQLVLQNALVNRELYGDLQIDSGSLITTVSLLEAITTNIKTQSGEDYRKLNDQFDRMRADLLPVFKWIKDHKPLPTPEISKFAGSNYWSSAPNSASSPTKSSARTSQATSPVQAELSPPALNPSLSSGNLRNLSARRKSILSPTERSSFSPIPAQPSPTSTLTATGTSATGPPPTTASATLAASSTSSVPTVSTAASSTPGSSAGPRPQLTPSGSSEPLKQLRAKTDDPCYKILQHAMRRHGIANDDWRKYALVICYGDQERVLELNEKPVVVFRELQEQGQHPAIMLRQIDYNDDDETINATPGGRI